MYARYHAKPFTNISSLNPKTIIFVGYCCSAHFIDENTKVHKVTFIGQGHTTSRFPKSGFEPHGLMQSQCT